MKKAVVIGLGVSGQAAAQLLLRQGFEVLGVDRAVERVDGVTMFSEAAPPSLEGVELALISPGIPAEHPFVHRVHHAGIECIGEVELALRGMSQRIVGITGSNGKTTTVLLLEHLFRSAGKEAIAVGNVGLALTRYALHANQEEILFLELSSFQLERLRAQKLELAIVLNLTPNHLDRHGSMEAYATAKLSIRHCIGPQGRFCLSESVVRQFGAWIRDAAFDVLPQVPYTHPSISRETMQAVGYVANHFDISHATIEQALCSFQKPPHRIEFVVERSGVLFYNDSKATNIDAVMHAVSQLPGPLLLLAGGVDKGASYMPWIEAFQGKVKALFLFGRAASLIEREMAAFFSCTCFETLEQAVQAALAIAQKGDTILLSPGCASYDQFRSFEHRGEEYRKIVRGL